MHNTFLAKLKASRAFPFQRKQRWAYEMGFKDAWNHTHALSDREARLLCLSYLCHVNWGYRQRSKGAAVSAAIEWMKRNCVRLKGEPRSFHLLRGFLARTGCDAELKLFVVNEQGWTPGESHDWCSCEVLSMPDVFPDLSPDDILDVDILLRTHEENTEI